MVDAKQPKAERRRSSMATRADARKAAGKRTVLDSFRRATGEAVPLAAAGSFETFLDFFHYDPSKKTKTKVSLATLLSFSTPSERCWMAFGLLMATISGFGIPAWLMLLARSLDTFSQLAKLIDAVGGEDLFEYLRQELNDLCIAFTIVGVVSLVTGSLYVTIWTYTGEKQALRIQKAFVRSVVQQDAAWFDLNDREALPTKMGTSLIHVQDSIGRKIVDTYSLGVSALGCLAVALVLNTALSLIMLAILPAVAIVMVILNYFIRRSKNASNNELAAAGSIATEVIAGIKTVVSLCSQDYFLNKYKKHIQASEKYAIRSYFLASFLAGITGMVFYITYLYAFYLGTEQVITGAGRAQIVRCFYSDDPDCRVTGASVMCCIYGVILCVTFAGLMSPGITSINVGQQAAVEVFATISRKPPIDPSENTGKCLTEVKGDIEFRDLFFYYPSHPNRAIFHGFNLKIAKGESVALVGPSGSGKSTIARFLLRFYDPNSGNILIDGEPLTNLKVSWWRSQVGYVSQEPRLFPGTIRDNIAAGKDKEQGEATDKEVIEAAKAACAHEFIQDLPDGYDTFYSGTSVQLSGGQMQRIAIARAIIRNPAILVLDEATSALDSASEHHVQEALENVRKMKKMTTVTIAHRLSTIVNSDKIAVLNQGKVVELGDHKSLMEKGGIYALLCQSQGITADFSAPSSTQPAAMMDDDDAKKVEVISTASEKGDIEAVDLKPMEQPKPLQSTDYHDDDDTLADLVEVEMAPMGKIWWHLGWDSIYAFIGFLGSLILGALSPCESILTAEIVITFYTVPPDEMLETNLEWIRWFAVFALAAFVGNIMVGIGLSRSGIHLTGKLRRETFGAMLQRSMGWFDEPENTIGELTELLGADAEAVAGLTGMEMGYRVRAMASITVGVAVAMKFSFEIGLVAITCVPVIMLAAFIQVVCNRHKFASQQDGLSPATILEQGLRDIFSVQAYNLQEKVGNDYDTALEPESKGKLKRGAVAGLVFGISQCSIFLSFAAIFYVGTNLLVEVEIGFKEFFTALLAVMFGSLGASQVSADFNSRQEARAAAARLFAIMDGPTDGGDGTDGTDLNSDTTDNLPELLDGGIDFDQCEFHYPTRPNHPIFYKPTSYDEDEEEISKEHNGLTLSIAPKESIGLVGKSGSGKSSVLQLVLRFYEISGGSIKMDNKLDLKDVNVHWLRQQIGYVGQMPTLFNGTVKQNILLGKPDATQEEIETAARAAHAHEFIMQLSEGYETEIGAGGGQLSGGQKQRIAIARAIVRNPQILVLDEATAALDNESERIVQAALDDLRIKQPRTTLIVAHRLMTIKDCDKIAYLGDGGVKELGTHDELVEKPDGNYHKLWTMQGAEEKLNKAKSSRGLLQNES